MLDVKKTSATDSPFNVGLLTSACRVQSVLYWMWNGHLLAKVYGSLYNLCRTLNSHQHVVQSSRSVLSWMLNGHLCVNRSCESQWMGENAKLPRGKKWPHDIDWYPWSQWDDLISNYRGCIRSSMQTQRQPAKHPILSLHTEPSWARRSSSSSSFSSPSGAPQITTQLLCIIKQGRSLTFLLSYRARYQSAVNLNLTDDRRLGVWSTPLYMYSAPQECLPWKFCAKNVLLCWYQGVLRYGFCVLRCSTCTH